MCNFIEWRDKKIIYRRYASLYFAFVIGTGENELLSLEIIHRFVETLDMYFGNVCELDLIFNFHKAYHILDELIIGGFLQVVIPLHVHTFSFSFWRGEKRREKHHESKQLIGNRQ